MAADPGRLAVSLGSPSDKPDHGRVLGDNAFMTNPLLIDRWRDDEQVLAAIGAELFDQDTTCRVRVPRRLAERAVAAWQRVDEVDESTAESQEHEVVRERAAALALLGAQLEAAARGVEEQVEATLDAWFIGVALGAADDLDLLADGPISAAEPDGPRPRPHGEEPLGFALWLEFEHVTGASEDFSNVGVTCSDGTAYALNVWTFDFVRTLAAGEAEDPGGELAVGYSRPPDLLVRDLTRAQLTAAVAHLLANGGIPASCRVVVG